jgi:hypothetical protein
LQPGHRVHGLAAQLLGSARGEHAARHLNLAESADFGVQSDVEGRVDASGIAQQFEVGDDGVERVMRPHHLKVDRNLGTDYVKSAGELHFALGPDLRGQYVRGGQVRMAGIVWSYSHAPSLVPVKIVTVVDQQFATQSLTNIECAPHFGTSTFSYIHSDSRISYKDYKLSDCINRA